MAIKIGALLVDLAANTAAFQQDMTKAVGIINSSSAQMNRHLQSVEKGFGAIGAAARAFGVGLSVAAVVAFGKQAIAAAGALDEMSQQLGVSIKALQGYQYAAGQSGAKSDELQAGIAKVTREIGEAAAGGDDAIKMFRSLGVGILDTNGKVRSTEAVFRDIADRIAGASTDAERGRIAFEAFGKSGQRLIPMLQGGAAGLDAFLAKAEALGLVIGDDQVRKLDAISDSLDAHWTGALRRGAVAAEFFFSAVENGFNRTVADAKEIGEALDRYVLSPLNRANKAYEDFMGITALRRALPNPFARPGAAASGDPSMLGGNMSLGAAAPAAAAALPTPQRARDAIDKLQAEQDNLRELIDVYKGYQGSLVDVEARQKGLTAARGAGAKAGSDEYARILALADANHRLSGELRMRADADKALIDDAADAEKTRQAIGDETIERIRQQAAFARNIEQQISDTEALTAAVKGGARAYEVEAQYLRNVADLRARNIPLIGAELEAARKLAERQVEANRTLEQQQALMDELSGFAERSFDRIGSAITEAYVQGKGSAIDFANVSKAILSELLQEWIKLSTINPLKNWAFGSNAPTLAGAGGLLGSLFGSGGVSAEGMAGIVNDVATLPFFATGTDNAPRGWAWVGEQGPELIRMQGGEAIASTQHSLAGQPGGNARTIIGSIDMRGASLEAVKELERMLRQVNASIEPRSVQAVVQANRRGRLDL